MTLRVQSKGMVKEAPGPLSLPVRAVFDFDRRLTLPVPADTLVRQALRVFADRPELRAMFVVDRKERLIGVLTRNNLVAWIRDTVGVPAPGSGWSKVSGLLRTATVADVTAASDRMVFVHPDDAVEEAMRVMIQEGLVCIPVVDAHGHILGDLRLSELLKHVA